MNTNKSYVMALVVAAISVGCVGTGPNTQQGAVMGGALGAVAGGIIGNNSRSGDALGGAMLGGIAGAIVGGTVGNSIDHQLGTIYRSEVEATTTVYVESPPRMPPPPREVIVVRPAPEYVWVGGFWAFSDSGRYTWVSGRWMVPPPQARHFVNPHWKRNGRSYVYIQGYWH